MDNASGRLRLPGRVILTAVLVKSIVDLSDPANSEPGDSRFGLAPPLVIGAASCSWAPR